MKNTVTARITINVGSIGTNINVEVPKKDIPSSLGIEFYQKIYDSYKNTGHWSWGVPTFASVRFMDKTHQVLLRINECLRKMEKPISWFPETYDEFTAFENEYCVNCKHDNYDTKGHATDCVILAKMYDNETNPEGYPVELIEVEGKPTCTKFESVLSNLLGGDK